MNERISFVVLSCGLRETSMMVDYTERRKTERKNVSPSPGHHREKKY